MTEILPTRSVAKPWGRDVLPPPFAVPAGERIGEIWFEPPERLPELLVKYIFTSEALSVQVHPSDAQTEARGLGRQGKEECWLVIAADPGATLGIGFARPLTAEALRAAALDGSIERLLVWHPVQAGDFFYIPANTVHAIGAGVSLIEVQQNSDITYRLYDYGRPRELHLDEGVAVAKGEPYADLRQRRLPDRGAVTLVNGPLFRLDRIDGPASAAVRSAYAGAPLLVIPRTAGIAVGGQEVAVGQCALARDISEVAVTQGALALLTRPL
ncbi:MAG: mannose-6-phosphate isomerase [Sphingomonadales bacterium]|nr:mannose-6-phosphate isomerase [Sphingomonadales bacterium]MBU3993690.1 class I mannose-6-phosphate isomerase [Alphaproteobacteria bacterium]